MAPALAPEHSVDRRRVATPRLELAALRLLLIYRFTTDRNSLEVRSLRRFRSKSKNLGNFLGGAKQSDLLPQCSNSQGRQKSRRKDNQIDIQVRTVVGRCKVTPARNNGYSGTRKVGQLPAAMS
jgi:hypothetical protein